MPLITIHVLLGFVQYNNQKKFFVYSENYANRISSEVDKLLEEA
jgi:hypothetical protein|tara:strand:- start:369 stop:500 length:132 start_codon:yes stop_codon:yes gene_type:complete